MATVRKALADLPDTMELQKYYQWLRETELKEREQERKKIKARGMGEGGSSEQRVGDPLGRQAERLFDNLLTSADEDIANKIRQIVEQISAKVRLF